MRDGSMDLIEFLFALLLALLSGYAILDSLSRNSPIWKSLNGVKRVFLGFGFGLSLDFGIIVPLILLSSFWTSGADWFNAFQNSSYLLFAYNILLFLSGRILKVESTHLNLLKIFLESLFFVSVIETVAILIISQEVRFYPFYLGYFLIPVWGRFLQLSLICLSLIFTLGLLGFQFFIFSIIDKQLKRELVKQITMIRRAGQNSVRRGLFLFKIIAMWTVRSIRVFSRRGAAIFLLLVVVVSAILVPIDMVSNLFTPRLLAQEEVYYPSELMPDSDINSVRLTIESIRETTTHTSNYYVFSRLVQKPYIVTQPVLPFMKDVYMETPRGFVSDPYIGYRGYVGVREKNTLSLIREDPYCDGARECILSPLDVETRFNSNEDNFTGIELHFQRTNHTRFIVSLSHWRPIIKATNLIKAMDVYVRYDGPYYGQLWNYTWSERHTFTIRNDSGTKVIVPSLELVWSYTYATPDTHSIEAFIGEKPCKVLSEIKGPRLTISPDPFITISPSSTLIFSVSFRASVAG